MGEWQEAFSLPRSRHQLVALAPSDLSLRAKDLRGAANAGGQCSITSMHALKSNAVLAMAIQTSLRVSEAIRRSLANQR